MNLVTPIQLRNDELGVQIYYQVRDTQRDRRTEDLYDGQVFSVVVSCWSQKYGSRLKKLVIGIEDDLHSRSNIYGVVVGTISESYEQER